MPSGFVPNLNAIQWTPVIRTSLGVKKNVLIFVLKKVFFTILGINCCEQFKSINLKPFVGLSYLEKRFRSSIFNFHYVFTVSQILLNNPCANIPMAKSTYVFQTVGRSAGFPALTYITNY